MSDNDTTPTRTRKPLGLKRSVDAGEVKQTFSHGRTNKVVVEVKRRRVIGKPGETPAPAPAPAPEPRGSCRRAGAGRRARSAAACSPASAAGEAQGRARRRDAAGARRSPAA